MDTGGLLLPGFGNHAGRTLGAKKASKVRMTETINMMPAPHRIALPAGVRGRAGCILGGT